MSDAKAGIVGVFGRAADTYDDVEPRHFSHFGRLLVEHARLPPEAEVLDVAAGKGAVLLRRSGPPESSESTWRHRWLQRCSARSTVVS